MNSIDAIAVAAGPGSFTGLRIGSATAKGLGLALDKPLIGVPTVDALAYNLYDTAPDTLICPIMDARRKQVYTGLYCFENHDLKIFKKTRRPAHDSTDRGTKQDGKIRQFFWATAYLYTENS